MKTRDADICGWHDNDPFDPGRVLKVKEAGINLSPQIIHIQSRIIRTYKIAHNVVTKITYYTKEYLNNEIVKSRVCTE